MVLFVISDLTISVWKSLLQAFIYRTICGFVWHLVSGEATFRSDNQHLATKEDASHQS